MVCCSLCQIPFFEKVKSPTVVKMEVKSMRGRAVISLSCCGVKVLASYILMVLSDIATALVGLHRIRAFDNRMEGMALYLVEGSKPVKLRNLETSP